MAANPGDFQALGRNVVMLLAKLLVLMVAGGLSGVVGYGVWKLSDSVVAGVLGDRAVYVRHPANGGGAAFAAGMAGVLGAHGPRSG